MSVLINELKELENEARDKYRANGKEHWKKLENKLKSRSQYLKNYLKVHSNYFFLLGIKDAAEVDGFTTNLSEFDKDKNATLTISW